MAVILSALYVILSFIPISPFIGGPSILSLNLIVVPIIAIMLSPPYALMSAFVGCLVMFFLVPTALANIFGPMVFLMPMAGAAVGSVAARAKSWKEEAIILTYFVIMILLFLVKIPQVVYWTFPHALAAILILILHKILNPKLKIIGLVFLSTMAEQACMMVLASWYLALPWQTFVIAFPLMLYERILATIGGSILLIGIERAFKILSE